ncbi:MAG: YDG domain-containing protein, partial [Anaerolineales bacterium]
NEVEFEIRTKHLTGSFTVEDKVYDGTTAATVLTRSLSGAVSGDDVNLVGGTATFSDKNVGTDKTVTLTGASLSGTDAGNYVLDSVATTTADIREAPTFKYYFPLVQMP